MGKLYFTLQNKPMNVDKYKFGCFINGFTATGTHVPNKAVIDRRLRPGVANWEVTLSTRK